MAFCENCGAPLADGAKFCGECGSAVARPQQPIRQQPAPQGPQPPAGSSIVQGEDGAYHWVFEYNLWRDPTGFLTVLKAFVGVGIGILVALIVFDIFNGDFTLDELVDRLRFDGIFLAALCGLAVVGYVIYAIMQGGKYCVVFTMDEEGIEHRQMPKQYEKAQVVGALNVALGLATGNVSQVGIGLMGTEYSSMESYFPNVRSIQGYPRRGVIKVNEPLAKNQVYVEKSDYEFVYAFIRERCPRAKIRGRG